MAKFKWRKLDKLDIIKIWFYDGVVVSYDDTSQRHKIVYTDGDVEKLSLKKERWKFTDDGDMDLEPAKNSGNLFSSGEPKRKRARTSSTVISKKLNTETP